MIIIGERVDLRGGVIQTRGTAETAGRIEHTDCAQWWVATGVVRGSRCQVSQLPKCPERYTF